MKKTQQQILRLIVFLSFIQFSSVLKAQVVPNIDWVQHYVWRDSTDNSSTTLDADNNVYVTGYAYTGVDRDLIVLKYDSLGTLLWSNTYDNGGDDVGTGIKVDITGNVHVCGTSYDATSLNDVVYFVYSSNGTQLAFSRYDAGYNLNDEAVELKYSNLGSDAFVIGTSDNGSNTDALVIKYNPGWTIDWANLYDSPYNGNDVGVALTLTSNNDVFCTGNAFNGSDNDIWIFMLDNSGSVYWNNFVTGNTSGDDLAQAIVTSGDNAVVCGQVYNSTTNEDYTTFRIDGSANIIWQQDYDNSNSMDFATSLVRDSIGNIGTTGLVLGGSGWEYHTIMYDSTGTQLWINVEQTGLWGAIIEPRIAVDTVAHHFYVSGSKQNTTSDVMVYQITPSSGTTSWRQYHDGPAGGFDVGTGIAVSGLGVIYLSANEANTSWGYNQTTIRLSQTPVYYPIDFNNANEAYSPSHYFYPNTGEILIADTAVQVANEVLFYTKHTYPQQYVLDNNNIAFVIAKHDTTTAMSQNDSLHRVDIEFWKNNPHTHAHPFERSDSDGVLNYYIQQISAEKPDVYGNKRLMIPNLYHNIDLHLYSNNKGLKMYFVVKPFTDPSDIIMQLNGSTSNTITGSNQLLINTLLGSFSFENPQVYSVDTALTTYSVTSSWNSLGSDRYSISTGTYVPFWPLVIQINQGAATTANISNINWSTYFGGGSGDQILNSKSDASNNLYICGTTLSSSFPQGVNAGAWPTQQGAGTYDGFLAKFDGAGKLEWTTYVGGNKRDRITSLDFNNGKVFCVGVTTSSNMPIANKSGAYNKSTFVGPLFTSSGDKDDGFIFQTNMSLGNTNEWLTYYGGNSYDYLNTCKFDANGNFYVGGYSMSTNLGVVASGSQYSQNYNTAQQAQITGGDVSDAIIMTFTNTSFALNWATYFGTHLNTATTKISDDEFADIAFDGSGNVYAVGRSGGISMPGAANSPFTTNGTDGIAVKFSSTQALTSSIYTNKTQRNAAVRINNNQLYTVGFANTALSGVNSGNYYYNNTPSTGFYDGSLIVTNLSLNVSHATLIGGNDDDKARSIEFDANGIFYIAGGTRSTNFPIVTAPNTYSSTSNSGSMDYFVCAMRETYTNILWSTYLGSSGVESDFGQTASIAIDGNNNMHVCGLSTSASGFPVDNGGGPPTYFQNTSAGGTWDGTITRFALANIQVQNIKESKTNNALISVYPNPTSNNLTVIGNILDNNDVKYNVYNLTGQIVQYGILIKGGTPIINVENLANGAYFINFNDSKANYVTKFIKVE